MVEWSGPAKRDLKQIHDYIKVLQRLSKYYVKTIA